MRLAAAHATTPAPAHHPQPPRPPPAPAFPGAPPAGELCGPCEQAARAGQGLPRLTGDHLPRLPASTAPSPREASCHAREQPNGNPHKHITRHICPASEEQKLDRPFHIGVLGVGIRYRACLRHSACVNEFSMDGVPGYDEETLTLSNVDVFRAAALCEHTTSPTVTGSVSEIVVVPTSVQVDPSGDV